MDVGRGQSLGSEIWMSLGRKVSQVSTEPDNSKSRASVESDESVQDNRRCLNAQSELQVEHQSHVALFAKPPQNKVHHRRRIHNHAIYNHGRRLGKISLLRATLPHLWEILTASCYLHHSILIAALGGGIGLACIQGNIVFRI